MRAFTYVCDSGPTGFCFASNASARSSYSFAMSRSVLRVRSSGVLLAMLRHLRACLRRYSGSLSGTASPMAPARSVAYSTFASPSDGRNRLSHYGRRSSLPAGEAVCRRVFASSAECSKHPPGGLAATRNRGRRRDGRHSARFLQRSPARAGASACVLLSLFGRKSRDGQRVKNRAVPCDVLVMDPRRAEGVPSA